MCRRTFVLWCFSLGDQEQQDFLAPRLQIQISLTNLQQVRTFFWLCWINWLHARLLSFAPLLRRGFGRKWDKRYGTATLIAMETYREKVGLRDMCTQTSGMIHHGAFLLSTGRFGRLDWLLQNDQWKTPLDNATNIESARYTLKSCWNCPHAMGKTTGRLCNDGINAS